MSMTFQIFFACISPSVPPAEVKSCEAANTVRPFTLPNPVITPSAAISFFSMPNSVARCFTKSCTS